MKKKRITWSLSLLLAGAVALPMIGGWDRAAANTQATQHYTLSRVSHDSQNSQSLVQLTEAEAGALELAPLAIAARQIVTPTSGPVQQPTQVGPGRPVPQPQPQPLPPSGPQAFANAAFQRTWDRTDRPVASGGVKRSWYWGPAPNSIGLQEDYAEGQGGKRLVQYFDKSRMEINNPNADPNNPFFVTNGLLTVELISGRVQTGNSTYLDRYPADIPLASDTDDTSAPTYLSFQGVSNTTLGDRPANPRVGQPATLTINRAGQVGEDPTKAGYPLSNFIYFEQATRHNIPEAIWNFLNESGPVSNPATGQTTSARLSDPWFYATGYPISEPYWARVRVAGQPQDVLIQAFERRVVTYLPNGVPGFKVQMGNIGQHYFDWRYRDAGKSTTQATPTLPPSTPAPVGPTVTLPPVQQPTNTPGAVAPDCSGIPASRNMTVRPNCAPGGTRHTFDGTGFRPGESVGLFLTLPDQSVEPSDEQFPADSQGRLGVTLNTFPNDPSGIWALTMEGMESKARAIGYFKLTAPAGGPPGATPSVNPGAASCEGIPASTNMQVRPSTCAPAGTTFQFSGSGFQPGEDVGAYLTAPDQSVIGAPFQVTADGSGIAGVISFTTPRNIPPGIYALTMEGTVSKKVAIGYFKVTPP